MKKNELPTIAQSCSSRICGKKYSSQTSEMCRAITTVHYIDLNKKTLTCFECGTKTKFS